MKREQSSYFTKYRRRLQVVSFLSYSSRTNLPSLLPHSGLFRRKAAHVRTYVHTARRLSLKKQEKSASRSLRHVSEVEADLAKTSSLAEAGVCLTSEAGVGGPDY